MRTVVLTCVALGGVLFATSPAVGAGIATRNGAGARIGQHWDSYLGVDVCDEWLDPPVVFEKAAAHPRSVSNVGIHSHGDGLIHVHPYVASEAGIHATVGKFFEYGGWRVSATKADVWTGPKSAPTRTHWSNGDTCPFGPYQSQRVHLAWAVDGKVQSGNPASYRPQRNETIALYVVPEGAPLPFPPAACNALLNPSGDYYPSGPLSPRSPCRNSQLQS